MNFWRRENQQIDISVISINALMLGLIVHFHEQHPESNKQCNNIMVSLASKSPQVEPDKSRTYSDIELIIRTTVELLMSSLVPKP